MGWKIQIDSDDCPNRPLVVTENGGIIEGEDCKITKTKCLKETCPLRVGMRTGEPDLERRANEWHERVFGGVEPYICIEKIQEEVSELDKEVYLNVFSSALNTSNILEEAGDVIMVLSHIIRHYGGTVEGCWRNAIEKCERRLETGER